jgi:serine/threonine protein kinase
MNYEQKANAIAAEILRMPPERRRTALLDRCGDNSALMNLVDRILREREPFQQTTPTGSIPYGSDAAPGRTESSATSPASLPERIGKYRIMKMLGQGGFGVVYLASAEEGLRRAVALKILRPGTANENAVRRFRRERAILPSLHHPNIAGFVDADETPDGQLYFVMEYVEGLKITDYCDQNSLTVPQRIELFRKVCDAVQHAHDRAFLHRDLKPANILVDREGEPKLLDFGIARTLSRDAEASDDLVTRGDECVLTPDYASPEQLSGAPLLTVASDVYSLGVILYELVIGQRPYVLPDTPAKASKYIIETRLAAPSDRLTTSRAKVRTTEAATERDSSRVATRRGTSIDRLRRQLIGDIDNIVLAALRHEPARRYESARELSEDLRRHLAGEPVRARGDSWSYRTSKFVRRHRVPLGASGLLVFAAVMVVVFALQASWAEADSQRISKEHADARRVQAEEAQAQARAAAAQVEEFLNELRRSSDSGRTKIGRQGKLEAALLALSTIAQKKGTLEYAELLNDYVAALSDSVTSASSGSPETGARAMATANDAVETWKALRSLNAGNAETAVGLAVALRYRARLLAVLGNPAVATTDIEAAMQALRQAEAAGETIKSGALRREFNKTLLVEAKLLQGQESTSQRLPALLTEALERSEPPFETAEDAAIAAEVCERRGDLFEKRPDLGVARDEYVKAISYRKRAVETDPSLARRTEALQALRWLGRSARDAGDLEAAEAVVKEFEALIATAPFDPEAAEYLDLRSQAFTQRGQLEVRRAQYGAAADAFGAARELLEESRRFGGGTDASLQRRVGQHHLMRAEALVAADELATATSAYKDCVRELSPLTSGDYRTIPLLATAHAGLARVAWLQGHSDDAETHQRDATELRRTWEESPKRNKPYDDMIDTSFFGLDATRAAVKGDRDWLAKQLEGADDMNDENFGELVAGVVLHSRRAEDRESACTLCRRMESALDARINRIRTGDMRERLTALRTKLALERADVCR